MRIIIRLRNKALEERDSVLLNGGFTNEGTLKSEYALSAISYLSYDVTMMWTVNDVSTNKIFNHFIKKPTKSAGIECFL